MVERKEEKQEENKEEKISIQEVEVNHSLLNNKLNYIITLLEKQTN